MNAEEPFQQTCPLSPSSNITSRLKYLIIELLLSSVRVRSTKRDAHVVPLPDECLSTIRPCTINAASLLCHKSSEKY